MCYNNVLKYIVNGMIAIVFELYGVSFELLSVGFSLIESLPLSKDVSSKNVVSVGDAAKKQFIINHLDLQRLDEKLDT